jgi:LAO/AO transport system kinase
VPERAGPAFATWLVQGVQPSGRVTPNRFSSRPGPTPEALAAGVLARDPVALGRAITLVESNAPAHVPAAQRLLARVAGHAGGSMRVGLTGVPGAGKSTFIEALGGRLVDAGKRVAVLAVDPSSSVTGGSILADKVRMETLARRPEAFIRPSPSGGAPGGVARKTREAILLCEAAGYDVVIVETVGVGQNEVAVRALVDCFVVLLLTGAGDELQGIKKGVMELADILVVHKADGDNRERCRIAEGELRRVLHYLRPATRGWTTPVVQASSFTGEGMTETWRAVEDYFRATRADGVFEERRRGQSVAAMHALIEEGLRERFHHDPRVRASLQAEEQAVADGRVTPLAAAMRVLGAAGGAA